jgi:putative Mn2+ efflux pump MntP
MNTPILWTILALIIALGAVAIFVSKKKREAGIENKPDYRTLFIIGVIWIPFGVALNNMAMWGLGLVFMISGLVNKKKWEKPKKWNELSPAEKKIKRTLFWTAMLLLVVSIAMYFYVDGVVRNKTSVNSFDDCVAAGNPIMESYPQQCRSGDKTFIENIGNEMEKMDLIRINSPRPNEEILSPLLIEGEAVGSWFFEGDFPVVLTDWDGLIIAEGYATAQGDWMRSLDSGGGEDFVPFRGVLEFTKPDYKNNGTFILRKDNVSDNRDLDDALEIPIKFK